MFFVPTVAYNMKKFSLKETEKILGQSHMGLLHSIDKSQVINFKIGGDDFYKLSPSSNFYKINKKISTHLLTLFPINNAAIAYVKDKSYFDFLHPHIFSKKFLRLDIKKFFHSINERDVKEQISDYFGNELHSGKALSSLIHNVFFVKDNESNNFIPIGFPASPSIANIVFRKIDIQIQKLCDNFQILYTRYSDDMLFSSDSKNMVHSDYFENEISLLISQLGLKLNSRKTLRVNNRLSLNGYMVGWDDVNECGYLSFSNKKFQVISKLIHYKKKRKLSNLVIMKKLFSKDLEKLVLADNGKEIFLEKYSNHQVLNKLQGFRSHLLSLIVFDKKNDCVEKSHSKKVLKLVESLNDLIEREENILN